MGGIQHQRRQGDEAQRHNQKLLQGSLPEVRYRGNRWSLLSSCVWRVRQRDLREDRVPELQGVGAGTGARNVDDATLPLFESEGS
jgi:hypothetical protein